MTTHTIGRVRVEYELKNSGGWFSDQHWVGAIFIDGEYRVGMTSPYPQFSQRGFVREMRIAMCEPHDYSDFME